MSIKYKLHILGFILIAYFLSGCKKLVEVDSPVTSITSVDVFNSDATAIAVLTGLYNQLSNENFPAPSVSCFSLYGGLSADEFTLYSGVSTPSLIAYYTNTLSVETGGDEFWNDIYPSIYICNSAIEGLNSSASLTPAVKQQLLGEALFMRGMFYFYLVNLYGDVPLVTGTSFVTNAALPRSPASQVYDSIVADLKGAQTLLSTNYVDGGVINTTNERVRPNKWAAAALLARTYLYIDSFASAETQATSVINNSALYSLDTLNGVFLANSTEAIWQLQPVNTGLTNTLDAYYFIIPSTGPDPYTWQVYLNTSLLDSFETGDQRKMNWIDSVVVNGTAYYYPYKYKINEINAPVTEYLMMLRLGEQYLIRAEARAQQGNLSGAVADLNTIRARAGLSGTTAVSLADLVSAIMHERQVELFTELGQRWLDLKRTNTINAVMSKITPQKGGGTWNTNQQLYPLPIGDIQKDPNLIQNLGY
jgi:hypothetical protein